MKTNMNIAGVVALLGGIVTGAAANGLAENQDLATIALKTTPVVLAQADASAGATPQPDFVFAACKETESTGDPMSAVRGVNPVGMLATYLSNHGHRIVDMDTRATIKPTLLEETTHGKLNRQVAANGQVYYMYDPTPNYTGNDQAIFMAEFEGKRYKIVVELHVFEGATPGDSGASTCPDPQLIKVTKPAKPSSGPNGQT